MSLAAEEEPLAAQVRARIHSLDGCYLLGSVAKGRLDVEILPNGGVSQVTVDNVFPAAVATCLATRVRTWKFSRFPGAPRRISWSLVFVATGENP